MRRLLWIPSLLLLPAIAAGQDSVRLEQVVRIGDVDGPMALTRINSLVLVDSLLFVSQSMEQVIRVVSTGGKLVRVLGGPGDGPGEFRGIDDLAMIDGQVVAVDVRTRRRTSFTPEGDLVDTRPLPPPSPNYSIYWIGTPYAVAAGNVILRTGRIWCSPTSPCRSSTGTR